MDNVEPGAERALPDLPEKIDTAVGHLTVIAHRLRAFAKSGAYPSGSTDAERIEEAMLLLAGVQELVGWEPSEGTAPIMSGEGTAEQLRKMADIGPRPPAVVHLLRRAADMAMSPPVIFGGASATDAIAKARQELTDCAERLLQAHRRIGRPL